MNIENEKSVDIERYTILLVEDDPNDVIYNVSESIYLLIG